MAADVEVGGSAAPVHTPRRAPLVILGVVGVCVLVVMLLILAMGWWTTGASAHESTAMARAHAQAVGLHGSDLPGAWTPDDPVTAPLSGLLGTNSGAKPTPQDRAMTKTITSDFQRCLGLSSSKDRFFGSGGVQPVAQVPSTAYSLVGAHGVIEVGTATQRYASMNDVAKDQRQASSPLFSTCLSQAMGRFVMAGAGPSALIADPVVATQQLSAPLGVFVTSGTAILSYPAAGGNTPIEVGTTLLMAGRNEQYLYTFTSPGSFSTSDRQAIVDALGARLVQLSARGA